MLNRSLRRGALIGGVLVFIALIGAPVAFAREPVIRGLVTLSQLLFAIGALWAGSSAASSVGSRSTGVALLSGAVAGAVAMALVSLLAIIVREVDLRQVLVNATPQLVDELTVGRGVWPGSGIVLVLGVVFGALGGWSTLAPRAVSRSTAIAAAGVVVVGVLRDKGLSAVEGLVLGVAIWAVAFVRSRWGTVLAGRYQRVQRRNATMMSIVLWIAGLFVLLALPSVLGTYGTSVIDLVGLYVLMGLGLNIVVGYAGLLDLGYVAFFTIGAYVTGLLTSPASSAQLGLSFWIAWPLAMIAAAGAGALLGIPVLRMRGDYLAIVTLGFGEIIRILVLSDTFKGVLGGAQGIIEIPGPSIGSFTMMRPQHFYYLILVGVMIVVFVSRRISDSRVGRAWMAIREDEDVAEATGVNLVKYKLLAFAMGASFSGIGGAIFASWVHSVFPNSFTLLVSINILSLVIVGGIGSIPGVILGAFVLVGLPEVLRSFADFRMITFGALLVAMMIARPEGLWPAQARRRELHAEVAE